MRSVCGSTRRSGRARNPTSLAVRCPISRERDKHFLAICWGLATKDRLGMHLDRQGAYRESNNPEVFQVSMLWASLQEDLSQVFPRSKVEELNAMFCRGSLDKELAMQVKLKNEDFELRHLPFLQSHDEQMIQEKRELAQSAPEHAFRLFHIKLQTEQGNWLQHVSQVRAWTARTHQARHDHDTLTHKLRSDAVDAHCSGSFGVAIAAEVTKALGPGWAAKLCHDARTHIPM